MKKFLCFCLLVLTVLLPNNAHAAYLQYEYDENMSYCKIPCTQYNSSICVSAAEYTIEDQIARLSCTTS